MIDKDRRVLALDLFESFEWSDHDRLQIQRALEGKPVIPSPMIELEDHPLVDAVLRTRAERMSSGRPSDLPAADLVRALHASGHPQAGPVLLIPAALACGFGELGKHGSIINRRFGSSFRLAGVLTDMPLAADDAEAFGADDFCIHCRLCADACPPDAIAPAKQMVRGVEKWYVDFDRCIGYFNDSNGCGICIAVCPWSRPGVAPKLAEKLTRRRERNAPANHDR